MSRSWNRWTALTTSPDPVGVATRTFLYGVAAWVLSGLLAPPLLALIGLHAGAADLLVVGAAWLFVLGPVGCAVAGAVVGRLGARGHQLGAAFLSGLLGVGASTIVLVHSRPAFAA